MTTRRRRKSGSGPSATALIAWVGGPLTAADAPAGAGLSGVHAFSSGRVTGGRAILVGRVCGLAAGTLLACGSVLAAAVHAGDGTLEGAALSSLGPVGPEVSSSAPDEYGATVPAERTVAAPNAVSAQALAVTGASTRLRSDGVHRNSPVSLGMPAGQGPHQPAAQRPWGSPPAQDGQASPGSAGSVSPVLDPAESGLRATPVGELLTPEAPPAEQPKPSVMHAAGHRTQPDRPREAATQPAMAMLASLLPLV